MEARAAVIFSAIIAVLFAVEAGAQSSAAAEWAKIVAAAKKEGKVIYYGGQPHTARLAEGFRKAHPEIAIEYVRQGSGLLLGKIEQERNSGADGADVLSSTETAWLLARAREGRLLKPSGPSLNGYPAKFILESSVVVAAYEPSAIMYNKNLVKNPPKSYADLLRPEFKGRIGTSDLVATVLVAWYDWLEKTEGPDYLTKLKAQDPRLYVGAVQLVNAIASGEIAVSAFTVPTATQPLIDQGAPLAYVVPKPAFGSQHVVAAFGWSKRPNAALVLLDWLMSPAGQTAWVGKGESASPRSGIPGSLPIDTITPWDPDAYPAGVVNKYREKWTRIFK